MYVINEQPMDQAEYANAFKIDGLAVYKVQLVHAVLANGRLVPAFVVRKGHSRLYFSLDTGELIGEADFLKLQEKPSQVV